MCDLITRDLITLDLKTRTKKETIDEMAKMIESQGRLYDIEGFVTQVEARENQFSTAVGYSVAIPHGKTESVKTAALAFARLENEVKWSDEESARYVFLIAVPEAEAGNRHLKILAQISRSIMREEFREKLGEVGSVDEVLELLSFDEV